VKNYVQFRSNACAGVKREVFDQMLEVLNESKAGSRKHPSCGTPAKQSR
jgi:hypothetical protein